MIVSLNDEKKLVKINFIQYLFQNLPLFFYGCAHSVGIVTRRFRHVCFQMGLLLIVNNFAATTYKTKERRDIHINLLNKRPNLRGSSSDTDAAVLQVIGA